MENKDLVLGILFAWFVFSGFAMIYINKKLKNLEEHIDFWKNETKEAEKQLCIGGRR